MTMSMDLPTDTEAKKMVLAGVADGAKTSTYNVLKANIPSLKESAVTATATEGASTKSSRRLSAKTVEVKVEVNLDRKAANEATGSEDATKAPDLSSIETQVKSKITDSKKTIQEEMVKTVKKVVDANKASAGFKDYVSPTTLAVAVAVKSEAVTTTTAAPTTNTAATTANTAATTANTAATTAAATTAAATTAAAAAVTGGANAGATNLAPSNMVMRQNNNSSNNSSNNTTRRPGAESAAKHRTVGLVSFALALVLASSLV